MPIVLLGGTPGVGKTTIAKLVAERVRARYVNVAELARSEGLILGYDAERDAHIIDEEKVREKLRQIERETLIIVDTHVASVVPPEKLKVAVILRLDPRELEKRLRSRDYPEKKVLENVQAEILDACLIEAVELFGEKRVFEIDASGKSIDRVVEEVASIIEGKVEWKLFSVNWLERLGDEALRYLRYA